jgi:hypothetical protein
MKTKLFAFLATVGVARSIFTGLLIAVLLSWTGLMCYLACYVVAEISIRIFLFISSFSLIIFGVCSKIIIDMLNWEPQAIKPRERLQKNLDIAITVGLTGLAGIIFWGYYEEAQTFRTVVFGITALCTVYLFHKNGLFGSGKFFLVLFIAFVIFILHTLILQDYLGKSDEIGNGKIMLVGFYVGLIALTKIPERFYQFLVKRRMGKKLEGTTEEKRKNDTIAIFSRLSLFHSGDMYIYFSEIVSRDKARNEEKNKKQQELYLESFLAGVKSGKKMDAEDTKYVCHRIGRANYKLDSEFLNAVIEKCLLNNLSYLVFTTVHGRLSLNEWPILFKHSADKKSLIDNYLANCPNQECYDGLFNSGTKVFDVDALTGLINCLGHFYKKSNDDLEKDSARKELQRLIYFAINCHEQMIFLEPTKERLNQKIIEITNKFWELGIKI